MKSSCLRFRRICSSINDYDKSTAELKAKLVYRGHNNKVIDKVIKEVKRSDREVLLKPRDKVNNPKTYIPRLCLTYIPGVTEKIRKIVKSHWSKINDLFDFQLGFSYKNYVKIGEVLSKRQTYPIHLNYNFFTK